MHELGAVVHAYNLNIQKVSMDQELKASWVYIVRQKPVSAT